MFCLKEKSGIYENLSIFMIIKCVKIVKIYKEKKGESNMTTFPALRWDSGAHIVQPLKQLLQYFEKFEETKTITDISKPCITVLLISAETSLLKLKVYPKS